ncbi:MAG: 16S rRNA (adenine(1518)-N(6)/adenine(1519)-N(6))-dimethyltransferase RsmA [Promethearchaeota archaeon]
MKMLVLTPDETKHVLRSLSIYPKKDLGQNFLIKRDIVEKIIELCKPREHERILEIGPGLGAITLNIADHVKEIIAVEIEPRFKKYLDKKTKQYSINNVKIINGDALKIEFPMNIDKIISIMPYSISAPLIFKIIKYFKMNPCDAYLMCQREFSKKLIAASGSREFSRISINVSAFSKVEALLNIENTAFYPVPEVESTFIKIKPKFNCKITDQENFFKLTRALFPYKNKKLKNAMKIYLKMKLNENIQDDVLNTMPCRDLRVRMLDVDKVLEILKWTQDNNIVLE